MFDEQSRTSTHKDRNVSSIEDNGRLPDSSDVLSKTPSWSCPSLSRIARVAFLSNLLEALSGRLAMGTKWGIMYLGRVSSSFALRSLIIAQRASVGRRTPDKSLSS